MPISRLAFVGLWMVLYLVGAFANPLLTQSDDIETRKRNNDYPVYHILETGKRDVEHPEEDKKFILTRESENTISQYRKKRKSKKFHDSKDEEYNISQSLSRSINSGSSEEIQNFPESAEGDFDLIDSSTELPNSETVTEDNILDSKNQKHIQIYINDDNIIDIFQNAINKAIKEIKEMGQKVLNRNSEVPYKDISNDVYQELFGEDINNISLGEDTTKLKLCLELFKLFNKLCFKKEVSTPDNENGSMDGEEGQTEDELNYRRANFAPDQQTNTINRIVILNIMRAIGLI